MGNEMGGNGEAEEPVAVGGDMEAQQQQEELYQQQQQQYMQM